jgi:hypothetical protein
MVMNRVMRVTGLVLALALLTGLGGCVYPAYYGRPGVVYSDQAGYAGNGNAVVDYDDDADYGYASPGYYYSPGWYGYGYGWPYVGLGFYGGYWGGRGGYRGPWRGGYYHHGGGGWGGHGGSHGGSSGGHSSGGHH